MDYVLSTNQLTKEFRRQKAVDSVNIHVPKGAIYGFIGRNGAGKTTFLKMISGLSTPTSGDFSLFGYEGKDVCRVFSRIGTLIEAPGVYPNMTAFDNMKLKCIATGINQKGYIEEILENVGLKDTGKKKVKNFSLGMKQRLGIALALVGEPDLLVLDEPINGLDPQGIVEIRDIIQKLNDEKNMTIIISSHILEELSKIATHYGIINNGRLIEELTREQLFEKCGEHIEVITENAKNACIVIEQMGILNYKVMDKNTIHIFERLGDSGEIAAALAKEKVKFSGISVKNESLEDYFLSVTNVTSGTNSNGGGKNA